MTDNGQSAINPARPISILLALPAKPSNQLIAAEVIERLGSWNWIKAGRGIPSIVVPGHPPKWSPPETGSSIVMPEQDPPNLRPSNEAHLYFFEALFTAVAICTPKVTLSNYDLVIDRVNLIHLLRNLFHPTLPLSFNVEVHGQMLLIGGPQLSVPQHLYYQSFRKHSTRYCKELRGRKASGYRQAVGINLGGLKLIVEHEVDCFTCTCHLKTSRCVCPDSGHRLSKDGLTQHHNHGTLNVWSHGKKNQRDDAPCSLFGSDCTAIIIDNAGSRHRRYHSGMLYHMWFGGLEQAILCTDEPSGMLQRFTAEPMDVENDIALRSQQTNHQMGLHCLVLLLRQLISVLRSRSGENCGSIKRYTVNFGQTFRGYINLELREITQNNSNVMPLLPEGFDLKSL